VPIVRLYLDGGESLTAPRRSAIAFKKTDEYDIEKSMEKIGPLYPVLKSADGRVIDGMHRKNVDKDWPEHVVNVTGSMALVARVIANVQRREVSPEEKSAMLKELAEETHWTPEQMAENTGMSINWVRKYLPSKYKNEQTAKLASKKHERSRTVVSVEEVPICPECKSDLFLSHICRECGHMEEADQKERHKLESS
jgi:transcriptional regulator with XRE-family HTH domain